MLPRHAVDPARERVRLITAHHEPALLFAHVHQVIRVAQTRSVMGELVSFYSLEGDVLVIDRGCWVREPDHRRDTWSPHACGVDHDRGLDRTLIGEHPGHFALGRKLDPGDAGVSVDR